MPSPFSPYQNATLTFTIASGALVPDSKGNMRPGTSTIAVTALLQQKRDPNKEMRPGVDTTAIWVEGYITAIDGQTSLVMPSSITPDAQCSAVWQGRQGRFYLEFTARSPYLAALNIDLVEKIRGYFVPSSYTIEA